MPPIKPRTPSVTQPARAPAGRTAGAARQKLGAADQRLDSAGWKLGGRRAVEAGARLADRSRQLGEKLRDGGLQRALGGRLARLSDAEKHFLTRNLHLALPFRDAADTTDAIVKPWAGANLAAGGEKAASIYSDGAGNALRHATWNALMVKRAFANPVGGRDLEAAARKAAEFANAHEDNPKNTNAVNRDMDLHNNEVGRQVAVALLRQKPRASDQELFEGVLEAFRQGQLRQASGDRLEVTR